MKRLLCVVFLLFTFAACSSPETPTYDAKLSKGTEIMVTVIIGDGTTAIYEGEAIVKGADSYTADMATLAVVKGKNIPYTYKKEIFDGFNNIKSNAETGWLLYVDGALALVDSKKQEITDKSVIEWKYENYQSAFGL